MMLKGQKASNIRLGNSFSEDAFKGARYDYLLANPPFGVEWKKVQRVVRDEAELAASAVASGPACRASTTARSSSSLPPLPPVPSMSPPEPEPPAPPFWPALPVERFMPLPPPPPPAERRVPAPLNVDASPALPAEPDVPVTPPGPPAPTTTGSLAPSDADAKKLRA